MGTQKRSIYRSCCIPGLLELAMLFVAIPSFGETYQVGLSPKADVSHETVEEIPGPKTRTTIGVKDIVTNNFPFSGFAK